MADLRNWEQKHSIGVAADPASRLSRSITKGFFPTDSGGNQVNPDAPVTDIETEHGSPGVIYRSVDERNGGGGTLTGPLFPSLAGLLGAATKKSSALIPEFYEICTAGFENLSTTLSGNSAPPVMQARIGCICSGFSLSFDRESPGPLSLTTNWFLNAQRNIAAASTTSLTNVAAGASVGIVCASATGFAVGDYVRIVDADNDEIQPPTQIKAIATNTITIDTTVDLDGSGDTALAVTKAFPGPEAFPALPPYRTTDVRIDFQVANAAGVFPAWGGDNVDVQSLSLDFDGALTPKLFAPNNDPELDAVWTRINDGIPSLTGTATLVLAQDAYLNYSPTSFIRKCRMRVMAAPPAASGSTVTTDAEAVGNNVAVTVSSASGFAVGDVVLFDDGTRQDVATITGIAGSVLTVDDLKVALNAGATVRNAAWEIVVLTADITASTKSPGDDVYTVSVEFSASVNATTGTIIEINAYNDNNA